MVKFCYIKCCLKTKNFITVTFKGRKKYGTTAISIINFHYSFAMHQTLFSAVYTQYSI